MRRRQLNTLNKLLTPNSGTTIYIDYSPEKEVLEVAYISGQVYQYKGVDHLAWEEYRATVISGGSSGRYVNSKIKPVYLNYEQIR